jgi:divalent metal cation (Fe/Co/Zn/Cd) transporter
LILILTALLACVTIVINGFLIVRRAFHEVLDGNVSAEISAEMRDGALEVTGVARVEKCRVRKGGIGLFVELHVWVDGDMPVRVGHQMATRSKII